MKLVFKEILALAFMSVASVPCAADWVHTKGEDDPFKGGSEHIVMAVEMPGVMAGFRCSKATDLVMMFIPLEKPKSEHLAMLSALPAKLLVIIDDQPKQELAADLGMTPDGDRYRVEASKAGVATLVLAVAGAKKRVALAGEIAGKVAWSQSFSASGSRRALQPLIDGCKLGDGAAAK